MGNRGSRPRRFPAPRGFGGNRGTGPRGFRFGFGFEFEFFCKQAMMSKSLEHPGTNRLLVVGFSSSSSSSSSGACQDMQPIFNEFAEKYKDVDFVKMDVDEMADAVEQFGIQTTPAFVLIKDGKEVDRLVGDDREELERKIEKYRSLAGI